MFVIDVDDRGCALRQQFFKQPKLGGQVRLEVLMIVEMIARDVGESSGRDAQTIKSVLVKAMRRSFDREMTDAIRGQRVERAVQLDGVGCRQCAVCFAARRYDSNRANARGAMTVRGPDLPRERRDRSFAARSSDRRDR